ncbi:MAG: hypothetical protein AB2531_02250 [Candidatus Thiodiazotropha sp.]
MTGLVVRADIQRSGQWRCQLLFLYGGQNATINQDKYKGHHSKKWLVQGITLVVDIGADAGITDISQGGTK